LASYLFDVTRSYETLLIICTIGSFVAALVMLSVGRYPADFEAPAVTEPATASR
jgi:hypothetical protein